LSVTLSPNLRQDCRNRAEAFLSDLRKYAPLLAQLAEAGGESGDDILFLSEHLSSEGGFKAYSAIPVERVSLLPEAYAPLPLLLSASLWAVRHGVRLCLADGTDRYTAGICEVLRHLLDSDFISFKIDPSYPCLQVIPQQSAFAEPRNIKSDLVERITRFAGRAGNSLKSLTLPKGKTDEAIFRLTVMGGRFTTPSEEKALLSFMKEGNSFREALRGISSTEKDRFLITFHAPLCLSLPVVKVTESVLPNQSFKPIPSDCFSFTIK